MGWYSIIISFSLFDPISFLVHLFHFLMGGGGRYPHLHPLAIALSVLCPYCQITHRLKVGKRQFDLVDIILHIDNSTLPCNFTIKFWLKINYSDQCWLQHGPKYRYHLLNPISITDRLFSQCLQIDLDWKNSGKDP